MGFEIDYWTPDPGEGYAIRGRGGLTLHFFSYPALTAAENYAGGYWRVAHADGLYQECRELNLPGTGASSLDPIEDKP